MGWGTVGAWSIITFRTLQLGLPRPTPKGASETPRGRDTHGSVKDGGTSQLATTLVHKPRTGHSRTRNMAESMRLLVPEGGSRRGCPDYIYTAVMTRLSTVGMHGRHQSSSSDHREPWSRHASAPQNTHTTTLRCIILYNIAHYVHKYYCLQIILEFSRCDTTCDGWRRVNECSRVGGWSPGADHLVPDCTFNCWRG